MADIGWDSDSGGVDIVIRRGEVVEIVITPHEDVRLSKLRLGLAGKALVELRRVGGARDPAVLMRLVNVNPPRFTDLPPGTFSAVWVEGEDE